METQKQIHCIASISYSTSGTHQQYWIQNWNEDDASGTSYRYNDNCNRSAPTKKYNRKARISLQWCTRSRGCYQNLLQDLRKSSTAQNTATEICDGSSSGKPNRKIRSNSGVLDCALCFHSSCPSCASERDSCDVVTCIAALVPLQCVIRINSTDL